jgi:hypothetical protein
MSTVPAAKGLGGFCVGEVQTAFACQQEFASDRRHGIKQMNSHTRLGQHLRCHQAGRAAANNRHINLQRRNWK